MTIETTNIKGKKSIIIQGSVCYQGAIKLAAAILSSTYKDYVSALETIIELRKKSRLTKTNQRLLSHANKIKIECELFYKSYKFVIFTMGKSKPGEEIIKDIQNKIGFVEIDC